MIVKLKKKFIHVFGYETHRKKKYSERDHPFVDSLLKKITTSLAGPDRNQEQRTQSSSSTWWQGPTSWIMPLFPGIHRVASRARPTVTHTEIWSRHWSLCKDLEHMQILTFPGNSSFSLFFFPKWKQWIHLRGSESSRALMSKTTPTSMIYLSALNISNEF